MKLYRTRTQEEYDWLMEKLEDEGCFWEMSRLNPTARNNFDEYGDRTIIRVNIADDTLAYGIDRLFPNELITEVSDLMKEKQMKFQVGDEVRVVKAPPRMFRGSHVGEIHKVTMVDNSKIPYELSNRFWCMEEDIEPVVDHDVLMQKVMERNNKPAKEYTIGDVLLGDPIEPEHYNKGEIDLFEAAYRTRPFNEFRAIMEFIAERYMKRDKEDRIIDLDKAIYTLERLKEYEELEEEHE